MKMSKQTYYEILGLDKTATDELIQLAYNQMLKEARVKLQDSPMFDKKSESLKTAYQVLSNPELRKIYDDSLAGEVVHAKAVSKPEKEVNEASSNVMTLFVSTFIASALLAFVFTSNDEKLSFVSIFVALFFIVGIVFYFLQLIYRMIRGERFESSSTAIIENNQDKKNSLSWNVIVIILVVGYFGYNYFYLPNKVSDYEVTAVKIYKEYKDNELSAHAKYKDKYVTVSGIHKTSGVAIGGVPFIILEVGSKIFGVQCLFSDSKAEEASRLKQGASIKLKGVITNKLGNVLLNNCSVVK